MTEITRHPDPAFPGLEDALASEGAQAPAIGPQVPHFHALTRHDPYPWQRRLYARLVAGTVPQAVDVPTGCGKTACVLLALLAGLRNCSLPRRVVHIVDRRALVDQSADAVRRWVERMGALPSLSRAFDARAAFPAARPVALGVLRGGHADEGAWRLDPARPSVVVGTVDMVGSRLLFAGYGSGRSRRAMDAGLLGHDALVLLDEAHLSPAMAGLLDAIAGLGDGRSFRVMRLSATVPGGCGDVLGLGPEDLGDGRLRRRFRAVKRARLVEVATRAKHISALADAAAAHPTGAVAIFVERVADARLVAARLSRAKGPERVAVLTGTLRGHERAALASGAVWRRFSPERDRTGGERPSAYLVMTSAGEVGVDLDADHAVMDLAPLDSMVQRLGRVNRAGLRSSTVTVVHPAGASPKGARAGTPAAQLAAQLAAARRRTLALLRRLPDLSPAALREVDAETFATCVSPAATPARLDRAVVEAFAMSSADLPLPRVGVYLKGVSPSPVVPQTWLAWRRDVADLVLAGPEAAGAALSFFPPRGEELARAPTRYARRLIARALAREDGRGLPLVVLGSAGEPFAARATRVEDLPALEYATVVLPPFAGGLSPEGLADKDAAEPVPDVGDTPERVRYLAGEPFEEGGEPPAWVEDGASLRVPVPDEGGESERAWVYALRRPGPELATSELTWLGGSTQGLEEHGRRVGEAARVLGAALESGLDPGVAQALGLAGEWHDAGKARRVWQLAAGAAPDGAPLAKARRGRLRAGALRGYRHELGSLADAERELPDDVPHRDLVLHLVAAHHGWARPGFPPAGQWDPEASAAESRARAARVADRYARLSAALGPWRLAWLEALLKAADAWVSSGRDR